MFTRLLIPLDGSKTAEQAMPWARRFADSFKLPVELLAVVDVGTLLTSSERARRFDNLVEQASRESKAYLERISGRFAGSRVKRSVEQGSAADLIIEKAVADKSTLIAMTTHGRSGLNRWLLGSVAEKVLHATTNPLLLVRAAVTGKAEGEAVPRSIVVPLDGSELAESVFPIVANIATKLGLEIFLLRAYGNPYGPFTSGGGYYAVNVDELMKEIRDEARNYLEEKMAELQKQGVEKISYLLQEGDAADEIVSVANHTPESLIVMCSHGRSGVKRWVLGSVTETVVRHSNRPVLVVRAD
ncbi:MAG TPA: universal stress protein [Terriglobales bacterium]|nr:universal stress protein [Terriglobales bacterium]